MELKSETKYNFSTDINQLMNFIINVFYSKKEVFIKELLSNASDALDKIRYQALINKDILNNDQRLIIQIIINKEEKTLTIRDTGIGMTKSDLIENLGIIAKSGTKSFINYLKKNNDEKINLVGKFGIGFYSTYLVADKVTVITKNNDDAHYLWESNADGYFKIGEILNKKVINSFSRGTSIILHMKNNSLDYLEENKLKEIIKQYSSYVKFTIELYPNSQKIINNKSENLISIKPKMSKINEYHNLCSFIKEIIGNKISRVEVSNRNIDISCILLKSKDVWTTNIIFEINPNSSTIKSLKVRFDKDKSDPTIKDLVWLLYESAVIGSGFTLENPMNFTKRLNKIINLGLGVEDDEKEQ